jgi:hypothetical protein
MNSVSGRLVPDRVISAAIAGFVDPQLCYDCLQNHRKTQSITLSALSDGQSGLFRQNNDRYRFRFRLKASSPTTPSDTRSDAVGKNHHEPVFVILGV